MFASNIEVLSKALYHQQHQESENLELDPIKFENIIKRIDS